jgi:WD40 repeat protein/serine/threonine protein kinase
MSTFKALLEVPPEPEPFVRRGLVLLEGWLRTLALAALADWERTGVASNELFAAITGLQRPSWGSWNGLLLALRAARRGALREGRDREKVEGALFLARALEVLDEPLPAETARSLRPLADLARSSLPGKPRIAAALALPIALRNRIAHDGPGEAAWWATARAALEPVLALHAAEPLASLVSSAPFPAPWFLVEGEERWSFNGVSSDFRVHYVSTPNSGASPPGPREGLRPSDSLTNASREVADAGPLLLSFKRLLGKLDVQERDLRKLLAKLAPEDQKGVVLGDFVVGRPVGEGGFATVHVGYQLSTGRKVAIKVLRDGLPEDARARFAQEAAFLSRFKHPHVVGVLGCGEDAWSAPRAFSLSDEPWFQAFSKTAPVKSYIALEWIEGATLEDLWKKGRDAGPGPRVLAEWFAQAASALALVHGAGLVHRDVKPGNLMVASDGTLKLMDFGIARSQSESRTIVTATGHSYGTPAYMSPEQIRAQDADALVGPASDLYSLAATFYELFTGVRFFNHDTTDVKTVETRKLEGSLPDRPRRLVRGLAWEVETILMGGLEPEVADRYPNAAALERDLRRFLADEPIEYRRPSLVRRARLAYRRNRTVTNLVATFVVLAVAGTVASFRSLAAEQRRTYDQMVEARLEAYRAQASLAEADLERLWDLRARSGPLQAREVAVAAAELVSRVAALRPPPEADVGLVERGLQRVRLSAEDAALDAAGSRFGGSGRVAELGWVRPFTSVAVSPDGRWLVAGEASRWLQGNRYSTSTQDMTTPMRSLVFVWELATGKLVRAIPGPRTGGLDQLVFSRDGTLWAHAGNDVVARIDVGAGTAETWFEIVGSFALSSDGRLLGGSYGSHSCALLDCGRRSLLASYGDETKSMRAVGFSSDGTEVFLSGGASESAITILDAATGARKREVDLGRPPRSAVLSGDGREVLVTATPYEHGGGAEDVAAATVRIVDSGSGRELACWNHPGVELATLAPDGAGVLAAAPGDVRLWDRASGASLKLEGPRGAVAALAFSPDGTRAVAVADGVWVWERASGKLLLVARSGPVSVVAAFLSGERALSASPDGLLRSWDARTAQLGYVALAGVRLRAAALSPDASELVLGGEDGSIELREARSGRLLRALQGHEGAVTGLAFSPLGDAVASVSSDQTLRIQARAGAAQRIELPGEASACVFAPDGRSVIAAIDSSVLVVDRATPARRRAFTVAGRVVALAAAHVDDRASFLVATRGRRTHRGSADVLAVAAQDGVLTLFALGSGKLLGATQPGPALTALAFVDGEVVTGNVQGTVRLHAALTGDTIATFDEADPAAIEAIAADRGRLLLSQRGILRLRERSALGAPGFFGPPSDGNGYHGLAVAPDGTTVLARAASATFKVGLWDWPTRRFRALTSVTSTELLGGQAAFGRAGEAIAANGTSAVLLDGRTGATVHRFDHPAPVKACAISPDDRHVLVGGDDGARLHAKDGSLLWTVAGDARTVAFSPDGTEIAIGGSDGLRLVERATGRVERTLGRETVQSTCFSPDGREVLAASKDKLLRLYDRASGACVRVFRGHTLYIGTCAFSPDGRLVASVGVEANGYLWDRGAGKLLRRLDVGQSGPMVSCAFSADGRNLLATNFTGTMHLWDTGRPLPFEEVFPGFARDPIGSVDRAFDAIDLHGRPWPVEAGEIPVLAPPAPALEPLPATREAAEARGLTLLLGGSPATGRAWLALAAREGSGRAAMRLAWAVERGLGGPADVALVTSLRDAARASADPLALGRTEEAAAAGDPLGRALLAVSRNDPALLRASADESEPDALLALATLAPGESAALLERAAATRDPRSVLTRADSVVKTDPGAAIELYLDAVSLGLRHEGTLGLVRLHRKGFPVPTWVRLSNEIDEGEDLEDR